MIRTSITVIALTSLLIATAACFDESDPASEAEADAGHDAGEHTGDELSSADSIDTEGVELADQERLHVIEASDRAGVISDQDDLDAARFLTAGDVGPFLGDDDPIARPISGQGTSATHNGVRYIADGEPDNFGIGLQVWELEATDADAEERIAELRDQFTGVSDGDDVLHNSFVSRRADIKNLIFTDDNSTHLFIASCDTSYCRERDDLFELGELVGAGHADEHR